MSHYKRYPEYKDSGVEWLGQVPKHWVVSRLRHNIAGSLSYGANEAAESDDLRNPRFIRITDLNEDGTLRDDTFKSLPPDIARPYLLKDSDILLARSGATVGKSFIYRREMGEACYAGYLIRARLLESKFLPRLFWHCTQSSYYWDFIAGSNIQATIQNVSAEKYSNLWLAVPPITEQKGIVFGLDCETARIDALVQKKTRFIELLREKRQALITHAVTKGLDLNVKMKDSGVEWLGEVPVHWDVAPLKHVCELLKDGTHLPPARVDGGVPLLSVRNIIDGVFTKRDDDSTISCEDYLALCRPFTPRRGDVLLAVVGATLGKTAVVPDGMGEFHIQRSLAIFRPFQARMTSGWLHLIYQSSLFQQLLWEHAGYSAQPGIYLGSLAGFLVSQPSLNEQVSILEYVDGKTTRLDTLIAKTQLSLSLLKERRSALITAAVTGQVDLREAL